MKPGDLVILPQDQASWLDGSPLENHIGLFLHLCDWGNGHWAKVWWPGLDLINDYLVKELKVVNGA